MAALTYTLRCQRVCLYYDVNDCVCDIYVALRFPVRRTFTDILILYILSNDYTMMTVKKTIDAQLKCISLECNEKLYRTIASLCSSSFHREWLPLGQLTCLPATEKFRALTITSTSKQKREEHTHTRTHTSRTAARGARALI